MSKDRINVKLTTRFPDWSFIRQTPGSKGSWGNCDFHIDDETSECDWWVVFGNLTKKGSVLCCPENTILITDEPTHIKKYDEDFVRQFHTVITVQKSILAPRIINEQLLPWYVGAHLNFETKKFDAFKWSHDELKQVKMIQKTKLISVVSSSKNATEGYRQRLRFIKKLKKHFGDKIDAFGSGINPIPDKWDALAPYKYHIVLENGVEENYWTEKLADVFLANTYPIYYGCSNIYDFFSNDSLSVIDITKQNEAIRTIEEIIDNDYYEKYQKEILDAKEKILDHYQIFPRLSEIINNLEKGSDEKTSITLMPEKITKNGFWNRKIGLFGILLKKYFPVLYFKLKKLKGD